MQCLVSKVSTTPRALRNCTDTTSLNDYIIRRYFENFNFEYGITILFDTSVFGGLFDIEFEEENALLFEKVGLGQIICVYSNLTESELTNTPERVRNFFESINDKFKEKVFVTPEGLKLVQTYVEEKVVGETSLDDCINYGSQD